MLKGRINFENKESLVRILLNGQKGEKILLFEAFYPLYLPGDEIQLKGIEELSEIKNLETKNIELQIAKSSIKIETVTLFENKEPYLKSERNEQHIILFDQTFCEIKQIYIN